MQKKNEANNPIILTETSLVNKGFIIWPKVYTKEFRFCGNKVGNPARVANHKAGFASSCPLAEPAIY